MSKFVVLSVLKRLPKGKIWEKQSVPSSFPCSLDMFHYLQDSRIFNKQKISQQCLTDATSIWGKHLPAVFLKELVCLGVIECQERTIIFKTPRTQVTSHLTLLQSTMRSSRLPWVKKVTSCGLSCEDAQTLPWLQWGELGFSTFYLALMWSVYTYNKKKREKS